MDFYRGIFIEILTDITIVQYCATFFSPTGNWPNSCSIDCSVGRSCFSHDGVNQSESNKSILLFFKMF